MKSITCLASAVVIAVAFPAFAQTQKPASPEMSTPSQRMTAERFIAMAMASDQFEIQSSQMALEKATDPEVRKFAEQMIEDHTKASEKLTSTLTAAGITAESPATLDAKKQAMLDELTKASGSDFDDLYLNLQTQAHMEAVTLFRAYQTTGDNEQLVSFAKETLPTLEMHQDHVKKLATAK